MPKQWQVAAPAPFNDAAERIEIPLTPVQSNQVKAVGYDAATQTLAVTFTRGPGTVYQYPNVAPDLHKQFMEAESKGIFFGKHIKALPFKKFAPPSAD